MPVVSTNVPSLKVLVVKGVGVRVCRIIWILALHHSDASNLRYIPGERAAVVHNPAWDSSALFYLSNTVHFLAACICPWSSHDSSLPQILEEPQTRTFSKKLQPTGDWIHFLVTDF